MLGAQEACTTQPVSQGFWARFGNGISGVVGMSSSHKGMDGAGHALEHSDLPRLGGGGDEEHRGEAEWPWEPQMV